MEKEAGGPAGLLKKGTSWLDGKVVFATKDRQLADAAMMLWKISRKIRGRQGELGYSNSALGHEAGVRRQTVADVAMGTTWADAVTLGRICSVLGLELMASVKDAE